MLLLSKPSLEIPWRGFGPSLAAHGLALIMCVLNPESAVRRDIPESATKNAVTLFVPRPAAGPQSPKQTLPDFRPHAAPPLLLPVVGEPTTPEVRVDMNSIQIAFDEDVGNQLPDVVLAQGGMLALLDKDDPGMARYLIAPPSWVVREGWVDVSRKVRLAMSPPQQWTLLRAIALEHSIVLDHYRVCALFDSSYKSCLQEAIRGRAAQSSGGRQVRVQTARLAFKKSSPCGVEVLEVSFAPAFVQ